MRLVGTYSTNFDLSQKAKVNRVIVQYEKFIFLQKWNPIINIKMKKIENTIIRFIIIKLPAKILLFYYFRIVRTYESRAILKTSMFKSYLSVV